MKNYGMMMVCGNSVEELEQSVAAMKMAMATGATMGCGGATLADVEKGVAMLGGTLPTATICSCNGRGCGCCDPETYEVEDEIPTIAEILAMVGSGEIDADEAYDLIHEYYEVED